MRRTLFALLILAALLVAPTAAFAQDTPSNVNCGDLSKADCDFLKESRQAMKELTTYASTVNLDANLNNVPNLPAELSWSLNTDGRFRVNPDLAARLAELQTTKPEDAMTLLSDLMGVIADIYTDTAFDLTVDLAVSKDVAKLLSAQAGIPLPDSLSLPLRMVNGFVYANTDDLAPWLGISGWLGADLGTAMAKGMQQSLAQMQKGAMLVDPKSMDMMTKNVEMNQALQEAVKEYVSVERLDDTTVDGTDVAQFRYSFDLAGFISSPTFMDMLKQQIDTQLQMREAMGQSAPPISKKDIQAGLDMVPFLAPMLLSGLQWETVSSVGLEDKYVYETETNIAWDLSTVAAMAQAAQTGKAARPQAGVEPATFTLDVKAANSQFDEDIEIVAPEGALIIPLDQMQMQSLPVM